MYGCGGAQGEAGGTPPDWSSPGEDRPGGCSPPVPRWRCRRPHPGASPISGGPHPGTPPAHPRGSAASGAFPPPLLQGNPIPTHPQPGLAPALRHLHPRCPPPTRGGPAPGVPPPWSCSPSRWLGWGRASRHQNGWELPGILHEVPLTPRGLPRHPTRVVRPSGWGSPGGGVPIPRRVAGAWWWWLGGGHTVAAARDSALVRRQAPPPP